LPYLEEAFAARPHVTAIKLHHEIVERGYTGCYERVKEFVRERREAIQAKRRATVRFETGPGVEAQFDWKGHLTGLLEEAPAMKVWFFRVVLAYSRMRFTRAVVHLKLPAILADLSDAFERMGGVPHRVVFDNFKAAVISPRPSLELNPAFLSFCDHFGTEPAPALPYSPQRKGKVERSFLELENSDLLRATYPNLEALQKALDEDDARFANRIHSTTAAKPLERLERDREFFIPLPSVPFDPRIPETRRVLSDCVISYGATYYSVPHRLVGTRVTVKADPRKPHIDVFDKDELVASHDLGKKGERVIVEEHVAELRKPRFDRLRQRPEASERLVSPIELPQLVSWPRVAVAQRPIDDYASVMEAL
jgi:transposase